MRNGYGKSLFDTEDGTCYLCGFVGDTARHEVLFGAVRPLSKKLGLWIAVCPACHRRIHEDSNGRYMHLKEDAQVLFMDAYNVSTREFIELFGRNYL